MANNITLTSQELEELKDDITFRALTTQSLKDLSTDFKDHCKTSQKFRDDVKVLKAHRTIQWVFISFIALSILGLAFWILKAKIAVAN